MLTWAGKIPFATVPALSECLRFQSLFLRRVAHAEALGAFCLSWCRVVAYCHVFILLVAQHACGVTYAGTGGFRQRELEATVRYSPLFAQADACAVAVLKWSTGMFGGGFSPASDARPPDRLSSSDEEWSFWRGPDSPDRRDVRRRKLDHIRQLRIAAQAAEYDSRDRVGSKVAPDEPGRSSGGSGSWVALDGGHASRRLPGRGVGPNFCAISEPHDSIVPFHVVSAARGAGLDGFLALRATATTRSPDSSSATIVDPSLWNSTGTFVPPMCSWRLAQPRVCATLRDSGAPPSVEGSASATQWNAFAVEHLSVGDRLQEPQEDADGVGHFLEPTSCSSGRAVCGSSEAVRGVVAPPPEDCSVCQKQPGPPRLGSSTTKGVKRRSDRGRDSFPFQAADRVHEARVNADRVGHALGFRHVREARQDLDSPAVPLRDATGPFYFDDQAGAEGKSFSLLDDR